jgi:hypothetical protein
MNGIPWISWHQFLSLAAFLSWYAEALVAMINLLERTDRSNHDRTMIHLE